MASSSAWADFVESSDSEPEPEPPKEEEESWTTVEKKKTPEEFRMTFPKPKPARHHKNKYKRPHKTIIKEKCTEGHPECMITESQVCVFRIRKTIPCRKFLQGDCPYGDDCYFKH